MSSPRTMVHYLLVFDHNTGRLVREEPFSDSATAVQAYADAEREHDGEHLIEIVLVASDSIETIRLTHANYFAELSPVSRFLSELTL